MSSDQWPGGMIESGSNTPGVRVADFGLPPRSAFRYEIAAAPLRRLLAGYAVFDSEPAGDEGWLTWMLPGWPKIWINLSAGPINVGIRNRQYRPLASAVMYGATTCAMPVLTHGGVTVGIELNPLAWARLVPASAEQLRDRVTAIDEVLPAALVKDLLGTLGSVVRVQDIQAALDGIFLRHLPPPGRDEVLVGRILDLFRSGGAVDGTSAAAALGVDLRKLRRICLRYFGFPPKMLMMRQRFLNIFIPDLLGLATPEKAGAAPPGYHDRSHYLRDARRFLGMTPRRFLALDTSYLRATLRARRIVRRAAGVPPDGATQAATSIAAS